MILQLLSAAFLAPALGFALYYAFLCFVGLWSRPSPYRGVGDPCHSFAIVIPAHNEETTLPDVLCSCAALDYPADKVKVYVIADNCSDQTAHIARHYGANCLERHDPLQRGKGHALAWGLEQILADQPDAVLILDADCHLDVDALKVFDARLCAGQAVLQANYVASNPDESIVSYVAGVTNRLENDLFYAPKSWLGLAVLLRGTGMVFRRNVLERCPWHEHSIVEDAEYTLRLFDAGIRAHFVEEILVSSDFPARRKQLMVQRSRWIGGNYFLGRDRALGLILRGLRERSLWRIDFGWTLLACVRSLVVAELLIAVALALLCWITVPGPLSAGLLVTALALVGLHAVTFALAALRLGLNVRRLGLLCHAPRIIAQLLLIAFWSAVGGQPVTWERTPR
jgi:glycosyltransferase involved in cell wall biosynthesis